MIANMIPEHFQVDASDMRPFTMIAQYPEKVIECPVCKYDRTFLGSGEVTCIIDSGTSWWDFIFSSSMNFLVSEKVVDGLDSINATGFTPIPVRITAVCSKKLRVLPEPNLFFLDVHGRMEVDMQTHDRLWAERCSHCRRLLLGNFSGELVRYVPRPETWDGSDLFVTISDMIRGSRHCTRRILELARRERWTNCRFNPMDVHRDHSTRWNGIDYLGKQWPPEQWYPDSPSAGKTMEEWLVQMADPDREAARTARIALRDIGAATIPPLTEMLSHPSEILRADAARLLANIGYQHRLSDDLVQRVRPLLPPDQAKVWPPSTIYG